MSISFPRINALAFAAQALAALTLAACATSRSIDDTFSDFSASSELRGILFSDREHDYGDVDITIHEGRLMLTGSMATDKGRARLIENAWKAEGVAQVIDEIVIGEGTSFTQGVEDSRIDSVVRARLVGAGGVTSGRYKIAVSRGIVYLIGDARSQAELEQALAIASSTSGVRKVVNHVAVPSLLAPAAALPAGPAHP